MLKEVEAKDDFFHNKTFFHSLVPLSVKGQKMLIDNNSSLWAFCETAAAHDWITVDTEFMRQGRYWPQLCFGAGGVAQWRGGGD